MDADGMGSNLSIAGSNNGLLTWVHSGGCIPRLGSVPWGNKTFQQQGWNPK